MTAPARPRRIRWVPLVGLVVLFVRWLRSSGDAHSDERLRENMELTDAWLTTLGTALVIIMVCLGAALLRLR
jgi:hypothetical protein